LRVDAVAEEDLQGSLGATTLFVGVREQEAIAHLRERGLYAAHDRRPEMALDAGDDQPDSAGVVDLEAAGDGVRAIAELGDRLLHAGPQFLADELVAVDHSRDRGARNPGLASHVHAARLQVAAHHRTLCVVSDTCSYTCR
jgi:hypothetical protein